MGGADGAVEPAAAGVPAWGSRRKRADARQSLLLTPSGAASGQVFEYAMPAYELRRMLALAREAGEGFTLEFTRMPASAARGPPAVWRDFTGGATITWSEEPGQPPERASCTVAGGEDGLTWSGPCRVNERAFAAAPPPPRWLRKVLMAYPVPLFPETAADPGAELHCSA